MEAIVRGDSLSGLLEQGQEVHVDTDPESISIGQFVVFNCGDKAVIKEVIGIQGTPISLKDDGILEINSSIFFLNNAAQIFCWKEWIGKNELIPNGCLFVKGTTPTSIDSLRLGFISIQDIIGVVLSDSKYYRCQGLEKQ